MNTPPIAKSDQLNDLREIVARYPILSTFIQLYRVRIVLDANVVLSDLVAMVRGRHPEYRTALLEVLDSGTVAGFAPPELEIEVQKHLPKMATECGVAFELLQQQWLTYRDRIRIREPADGTPPGILADAGDLPYLYLVADVGAEAIYTKDAHLKSMGAPVVDATVIIAIRDYSRASSIQISIKFAGTIVVVATGSVLVSAWRGARSVIEAFGELPTWAKYLFGSAVAIALIHPRGQEQLRKLAVWLPQAAVAALEALVPVLSRAVENVEQQGREADVALTKAQRALPRPRPRAAWEHALIVCREEGRPLSTIEISRRVIKEGFVTRSPCFAEYMATVLQERKEFAQDSEGLWSLA